MARRVSRHRGAAGRKVCARNPEQGRAPAVGLAFQLPAAGAPPPQPWVFGLQRSKSVATQQHSYSNRGVAQQHSHTTTHMRCDVTHYSNVVFSNALRPTTSVAGVLSLIPEM